MVECEEKNFHISGFSLGCKIWHENNRRPVLFLHGKQDNAGSFDLLAPLLTDFQLAAVDYPGTGLSSHYPEGVIPYWKNDAFLILHLIKTLKWDEFDIIAHSLGSLLASVIAIALPKQVRKLVFLDILGPTVNFSEQGIHYLVNDAQSHLNRTYPGKTIFPNQEAAIQYRMKIGNISYQAARALVLRGTKKCEGGWVWTSDSRLHGVNSTIPYEDEIKALLQAIDIPVCLIRATNGVPYPDNILDGRSQEMKNLSIHEVQGGHHVHMDDPTPVAKRISQFLI
jgi:pimeloyl-ACP methyl ester carboxylesterase